jgi:three-Cys-motif partner protein
MTNFDNTLTKQMQLMKKFDPIIEVNNDLLFTPEVRKWSLEKYKLVGSYCDIFTSGMKGKWDQLVYIDLFAGAGHARIAENGKTYLSSSLIAMSIPSPFTKYILCEADINRFNALEQRIRRDFSHLNIELFNGDSNVITHQILKAIPSFKKGNTLLSFCFVDPYSLNLHFSTIKLLGAKINMDFLILQALHMDGNRNLTKYIKEENDKISNYLGNPDWRGEFTKSCKDYSNNFVKFLADQYVNQMAQLKYIADQNMHQIRSNEKNLPLYYLAFFSKHPRGIDFFKRIEKRANQQLKLDL